MPCWERGRTALHQRTWSIRAHDLLVSRGIHVLGIVMLGDPDVTGVNLAATPVSSSSSPSIPCHNAIPKFVSVDLKNSGPV